jgi:site-specific DNA recombinase
MRAAIYPRSPARAIGYVRVSTEQQAESGLGLDAQQTSVTAAASRLVMELSHIFIDAGTSAGLR